MARKRRGPLSYKELIQWLEEGGYVVKRARNNHLAVYDSDGNRKGTMSSSPSDWRSFHNEVSKLRKLTGLELRK